MAILFLITITIVGSGFVLTMMISTIPNGEGALALTLIPVLLATWLAGVVVGYKTRE